MDEYEKKRSLQVSLLVDGELPTDQTNALLEAMLDDLELQRMMKEQLRLRTTLASWRESSFDELKSCYQPTPLGPSAYRNASGPRRRRTWGGRMPGRMLGGTLLGGLLVLAGFFVAHLFQTDSAVSTDLHIASNGSTAREIRFITPEKQKEVEEIFAMHELVAGPLAWMIDSDKEIQLKGATPAQQSHTSVAVLLRMQDVSSREGGDSEYVVVCRADTPATIDIPRAGHPMRVHLLPHCDPEGDGIQLQYALSVPGDDVEFSTPAVLTGEQHLNLQAAPLGQFVVDNQLLDLRAGAWKF